MLLGGHDVKYPVAKQIQDELLAVDQPKCQLGAGKISKVEGFITSLPTFK